MVSSVVSRITSAWTLLGPKGPAFWLAFGGLILIVAFYPPEPARDQLHLVGGVVRTSELVRDWYGRPKTIRFTLVGGPSLYWTDRFPTELVSMSKSDAAPRVSFYVEFEGNQPKKTLAGPVKTYGLTVNDREIISVVDDYLAGETAVRHYIAPAIGAVFLGIGGYLLHRWGRRRDRTAQAPNNRWRGP